MARISEKSSAAGSPRLFSPEMSLIGYNFGGVWMALLVLFAFASIVHRPLACDAAPPLEFPKNESQYPFVHNNTVLKVLASQTGNDSEVDDLLHGGRYANLSYLGASRSGNGEDVATVQILPEVETNPKWDSELIENGNNTEDYLFNEREFKAREPSRNTYGSRMPLVHGHVAGILAIVLVMIIVVSYAGLLVWRRYVEYRYGNRQMLVNEEDFYEPSDLHHFSLSSSTTL